MEDWEQTAKNGVVRDAKDSLAANLMVAVHAE
jgi:hypothetical protein